MVRDIRFKKQEINKVEIELKITIQTLGMQLETMPGIDTVTSSALIEQNKATESYMMSFTT